MKLTIRIESFEKSTERMIEGAKRMDRGERIEPERSITSETPEDMVRMLSAKRLELLQASRTGEFSVTALAEKLNREPSAVRRDVAELKRFGLVRTVRAKNPGHGQVAIVKPVARRFELVF